MDITISSVIEDIDPEKAKEYLSLNVKNRHRKPAKIIQYARDMAAGRWKVTAEGIKFDWNGHLIDGQNRLYAVVQSGATIRTFVYRGLDPATQGIMDSGAPRSGADQLALNDFPRANVLSTVANTHNRYHKGVLKTAMSDQGSTLRLTNAEIVPYIQRYPELVEASKKADLFRRDLPLKMGPIGVAYDEFSKLDPGMAEEFFDRARNFNLTGKGDPIANLIKRANTERLQKRRIETSLSLFLLFRTWNAFRDGEKLHKIYIGSAKGGWAPMPRPH